DAELVGDDAGQARLAESGRTGEQHMISSLVPFARCFQHDREVVLDLVLTDELVQAHRPQPDLDRLFLGHCLAGEDLFAHQRTALMRARASLMSRCTSPSSDKSRIESRISSGEYP